MEKEMSALELPHWEHAHGLWYAMKHKTFMVPMHEQDHL